MNNLVFCLFALLSCGFAVRHQIKLYDTADTSGRMLFLDYKVRDLEPYAWYMQNVRSYCAQGIWRFYGSANYSGTAFVYKGQGNSGETEYCTPTQTLPQYHGSVRYFGPEDNDIPSLSLYSDTSERGDEQIIYDDERSINFRIFSLVSTGHSSWTLFSGPDYTGNMTCISSPDNVHTISTLNITLRGTQSIGLGCI